MKLSLLLVLAARINALTGPRQHATMQKLRLGLVGDEKTAAALDPVPATKPVVGMTLQQFFEEEKKKAHELEALAQNGDAEAAEAFEAQKLWVKRWGDVVFNYGKSKGDAGSELLQRLYTPEQLAALGLDPSGARLEGSYDHAAYAAWMCAEDALKVTDQPVAPDAEGDVFFDCVGNCLVEGDGSHIGFS